jgi:hypothetical protein
VTLLAAADTTSTVLVAFIGVLGTAITTAGAIIAARLRVPDPNAKADPNVAELVERVERLETDRGSPTT